jgi:hypothetical protein
MGCPKCGVESQLESKGLLYDADKFIQKFIEKFGENKTDIDLIKSQYTSYKDYTSEINFRCIEHNRLYSAKPSSVLISRKACCPVCMTSRSSHEIRIEKLLLECYTGDFVTNERFQYTSKNNYHEADFYFPAEKIAIEVHGLYWHSERKMPVERAQAHIREKYEFFKGLGIELIQLYEHEVEFTSDDVLIKLLKSKLGISVNRKYSKKFNIKEINSDIANQFFIDNHIYGTTSDSSLYLGLYDNDVLLSAMSFNIIDHDIYELEYFTYSSNIENSNIELFKFFLKNYQPKQVISYSNNRFQFNNIYSELGFNIDSISSEDYYYIHPKTRRLVSKSSLPRLINYNTNISEVENAHQNRFFRIWDAGFTTWKLN